MRTENFPVTYTQSPHDSCALFTAQLWIGIHGSHQNRGVLVIRGLLSGKSVGVDVNITGKGNVVVIIDQYHFAGQMGTLSL